LQDANVSNGWHRFKNGNKFDSWVSFFTKFIVCPNAQCREVTLDAELYVTSFEGAKGELLNSWKLRPQSSALVFPDYVPIAVRQDYQEACAISSLSPKASATLSRRCLQGIIRDFHGVSRNRLVDEIAELKDNIDPMTWKAIDSVRNIGNIGAHMERDINQIIEVDENEAELLLRLIEVLIKDWYIRRHEREKMMKDVINTSLLKMESKRQSSV